jgi:hypothetical protein
MKDSTDPEERIDLAEEGIITDKPELQAVMENLDRDEIDTKTRMSSIDLNTNLTDDQIKLMTITDELIRQGVLDDSIALSRQIKRLQISKGARGRADKVAIVQGQREMQSGSGFGNRLKNLFTPQPPR